VFLAKVRGNVVSSHKNEHLKGQKLMLVREIDPNGKFVNNKDLVSLDLIDSGVGDNVIVVKDGFSVKQILGHSNAPANTIIVGIVDNIEVVE
jgi:microcompartment protein CcmK/EutM